MTETAHPQLHDALRNALRRTLQRHGHVIAELQRRNSASETLRCYREEHAALQLVLQPPETDTQAIGSEQVEG